MRLESLIETIYEKKKLYTKKKYLKRQIYWGKRLFRPFSKKVYIIGCPEYSNLGDNAILIAEIEYLKKCGITSKHIECISEYEFLEDYEIIVQWIRKKSLICGLGGGNMGNQYRSEEKIRQILLGKFSKNPIVIFPQTIHYSGEHKSEDAAQSIKYYNARKNLTLIAREEKSQKIMHSLYPDTEIILTPDIVLSSTMQDYGVVPQDRKGALFCIRNDVEKHIDNAIWKELKDNVKMYGLDCRDTDMHSECIITKDNRKECVREKMQEFCGAELVFTDRLHGMVFAALTGTPCIVFGNYNHKVKGTYGWIKYLPYIRYVETIEEAKAIIPELMRMVDCKFDNKPLMPLYENIAHKIKQILLDNL